MKLVAGLSTGLAALLVGLLGYITYVDSELLISKPAVPAVASVSTESVVAQTPLNTRIELPQQGRIEGISVGISAGGTIGSGAVISNTIVITVQHVIGTQTMAMVDVGRYNHEWVPARVIGKLKATGEDIVVLQLIGNHTFDNSQQFKIGTGFRLPRWIVTPRGVYDFNPGAVVPGDSGGAILNIHGELIGLVTGYMRADRANIITMFR